jgi:hypothetical protein
MNALNQRLILAADNGTQLSPVAGGVPKLLVPVCGVEGD